MKAITHTLFYRSERVTLKECNKEVIFRIITSPCDILAGSGEEMELLPGCSMWCFFGSAPVIIVRCFFCCLLHKKQIFPLLTQSHKEERLQDEQTKASSLSHLSTCLLVCLGSSWLLSKLSHCLERNHRARKRADSHQMTRNVLLFHCQGPN